MADSDGTEAVWAQSATGARGPCLNRLRYAGMTERGAELSKKSRPKPERHEVQLRREAIAVRGVVQGVGFRPFVYRLAAEEGLAGFIGNDTGGVTIEIEGPAEKVENFRRRLKAEAPPLSRIDSVSCAKRSSKTRKGISHRFERCKRAGKHGDSGGRGDLRRLPARAARSERPALPLSISQLHQLRAAVHDHAPDSL